MRVLLDTHVLLWWLAGDRRLSRRARDVISNPDTQLYFSAASSWELAIKTALGRITLPEPARSLIPRVLREQSIEPLEIQHAHALAVSELPQHHRDPFDRLLVAQSRLEKLMLLSGDPAFEAYGVKAIW